MSKLETNTIDTISGSTNLTLGGTNATDITIPSGVTLTNNGTQAGLTLSDNILFNTADKGIYLGVTTATASNLLDDYEEGTWTPSISSGITSPTYTTQRGYYTKIGNTVHFNLQIVTSGGTAAATRMKISGLPFTSRAATDVGGGAYFIYTDADLVNSTTRNMPLIFIEPTTLEFYDSDGGFFTGTEASNVASLNFYLAGTYYTT